MARTGRPTAQIRLSEEERETLERWARRPKSAQALAFRCRIVLAAAEGRSNKAIAAELGCNPTTVGKWRNRFAQRRLEGLHDEPRPGKPRTIDDDDVERVIVKTLEEQPTDATHWSTRSMAAATGMSRSSGASASSRAPARRRASTTAVSRSAARPTSSAATRAPARPATPPTTMSRPRRSRQ